MSSADPGQTASLRRSRRVQDSILAAAHRACDEGLLDLAGKLLRLCEEAIGEERDPRRKRQDLGSLFAAHERLWQLRHPEATPAHQAGPTAGPGLALVAE